MVIMKNKQTTELPSVIHVIPVSFTSVSQQIQLFPFESKGETSIEQCHIMMTTVITVVILIAYNCMT